ncbi:MAG TPA: pteridine reductase [Gammaproteobacteria bacterium]
MAATTSHESLEGRWALVTGAARRIGATIAEALHTAGMNVIVHFRSSADDAELLVAKLNDRRPNSALAIRWDLGDSQTLTRLIDNVVTATGRLDVLVNNASSFYPTPLGTVTEEQWDDLVGSNLKAPLFLCQAALPHLKAAGGTIVNIVDVHSQRPLRDHPVYGSAKAGLAMLTRSLARDLGPDIRVNGVSPGAILWPESGMSESIQKNIVAKTALKRAGEPSDIAAAVLFLVRDAPYVTGQILAVDGGRSTGW